jgi:EmrB/QacA subfamily drug resistance transporter
MDKKEKLVVVVAILSSLVAFLDSSIVNVALPAIQKTMGGGLAVQQWIVDGYLLTLGSFILIAGSLSDLFGRKKILTVGLVGFGITSLLCAAAPTGISLIIMRALQGLFAALLVPSSLAIISAFVSEQNFSYAIGQWTSWTSIAFIIGPLLGGFLTDSFSWRWIFGINVIPIVATLYFLRHLPEEKTNGQKPPIDLLGAALCALGLGALVFGLIQSSYNGFSNPLVYIPILIGIITISLFIHNERAIPFPMVPLNLFDRNNFRIGNLATFFVYAGLSAITFLIVIFLQQSENFSALQSGLSLLPITIIIFLLSPIAGRLSKKYGPRWFMAFGPILAAIGLCTIGIFAKSPINYWLQLFPGIVLLGAGIACTVAPLTSAILSDVGKEHSGIASAINNAVARIAGLIAIAAIGFVAFSFNTSMFAVSILLAIGGVISAIGIKKELTEHFSPTI